ncbi:MAG: PSD1 and planctomycete cytochrome C domain-containing protein, partial [Planctomycetota bacterium]|nr:PSD1 and planctomycete cytochrome C domain-containing protein [Planctomycetota bacterium]
GLRLDTADGATKKSDSGQPAVVPGSPDASELVARLIATDAAERMPPPETGRVLKPAQIETLRRWIAEGAKYARHWSFEPPRKQPLPKVQNFVWAQQELDRYVLGRLEREGLGPNTRADKATLARRAALDIIGIPPDSKTLATFLQDESPLAFERYVDTLLASPHFGERWARHWLDLGRYADTKGYEKDLSRTLWRWRDWVIDAFNADMPYDQCTREQLAGALLPGATRDQFLATGFHRNTMVNDEGGTDDEEFRVAAVKDRVDTTIQVWMGLTMGCAKCHSHKYDPISHSEYYQFYAFFNQTEDADRYDEEPKLLTPTRDEERRTQQLKEQLAAAELKLVTPTPEVESALAAWEAEALASLTWQVLKPTAMLATSGSTLELKDDGSVLAKGDPPTREAYVLRFNAPAGRLNGLRLEVLPDPANPKGGAGRSRDDGNFVLSGIRLAARGADGKQFDIPLVSAEADFSQQGYPVESVLNNSDPKKKGWAISPKLKENHAAIFGTEPRDFATDVELTVTLSHEFEFSFPGFAIGRFRLGITAGPASLASILQTPVDKRSDEQKKTLLTWFANNGPATRPLRDEIAQLKDSIAAIKPVSTPVLRELPEAKRRVTKIQKRGNFLEPGEEVLPATIAVLHPFPQDVPLNRLGVAQWLMSRENPLTARVAANRIWSHLFGRGLVETEEDFGASGTPPPHPELLDWLAVEFREQGWSFKKLIRTIVLSATYQQSSRVTPDLLARDRDNRLLARGPRFRLEAEMIRDQALAASGLLGTQIGRQSVFPWQPAVLWTSTYNNTKWETSPGDDRHRRGLYTFIKRTTPYPQMVTFDGTSRETCTIRRVRTNTPLQALTVMNDPVFVECAQSLARKMADAGPELDLQLVAGLKAALLRDPRPAEIAALRGLYHERLKAAKQDLDAARRLATEPLGPLPESSDPAHLAALTAVANVILNLDEFLTKG